MSTAAGFAAEAYLRDVLGARNIKAKGDEITHACLLLEHEHDYNNPGASLNAEKLLYNCWKCGSGGTLLWLTEEVLQINAAKARKLIKEHFDSEEIHEETFLQGIERMWTSTSYEAMPRYSLKLIEGMKCYTQYMDDRGITREVQKEMMTGLFKDNKDDIELADGTTVKVTQPRVVIPHIFGGVLRGWTMRLIDKRQLGNKYKHTGQFPKAMTLYNFDNARKFDDVIVVESPMSVLKLKSVGIHNVVATFGAEINPEQERLLAKFGRVIAFPDGDAAGYRAMRKVDKKGNMLGLVPSLISKTELYVVDHGLVLDEEGTERFNEKDPADYTGEELRELLAAKVPAMRWDWRDDSAIQKVVSRKVRFSDEESWD